MPACCNAPMVSLPAPDSGAPSREVGVDGLELGELPLPLPLPLYPYPYP